MRGPEPNPSPAGLARSRGESLGEVTGRQEQGELDQEANIVFQPLRMRNQQRWEKSSFNLK